MKSNHSVIQKFGTKEIIAVICIVAFAGIIRIPSLTQPMGPDQGIMSVIGSGILQGGLPYRDYWEMGSPPIFFTYALIFKLFGTSMAAIPIADTLVSMLTTLLIYILARTLWGRNAGYLSALFFAFFSNGVRLGMHAGGDIAFGTFWYISQRETFMLPLSVASVLSAVSWQRTEGQLWKLVLAGFFGGLTFAFKFPSLLIFLCVILYVSISQFFDGRSRAWKNLIISNTALVAGFVLALVPFALLFAFNGALHEMIDVIFGYVSSVYGSLEHNYLGIISMGMTRTLFIAEENFIPWMFLLASSAYIIARDRTKENLLIVLWAVSSILFFVSHREFFGYHYLIIFPSFSLLAGYGMVKALGPKLNLRTMFTQEFSKVFILLALVANIVFFAALNYMHYTKFFYYATGKISKEQYYDFFNAYPKHDYSFAADYRVAEYIKNNTNNDDMIYALGGIESVVYFLTKRESPSRFIFSWIIFNTDAHGRVEQAKGYRREVLNDLKDKTPKYILTVKSLESYQIFKGVYHFINNNYSLEKTFPDDRFLYVYNGNSNKKI